MTKRLFYLSLSLLCLVSAYQLGADRAMAEWDANAIGAIIGLTTNGPSGDGLVYTSAGEAWALRSNAAWVRESWVEVYDLPVLASEVKFIDDAHGIIYLITTSDEGWVLNGSTWVSAGPFPGGPVPLQSDSWGKVKDRYRD
jgi:hypothetical protein